MRPFEFPYGSAEMFVERARTALRQLDFDDIVSLRTKGDELIVRFTRLGTSELRFRVIPAGAGFRTRLESSRVSTFHAPFRQGFEQRFTEVLAHTGATLL